MRICVLKIRVSHLHAYVKGSSSTSWRYIFFSYEILKWVRNLYKPCDQNGPKSIYSFIPWSMVVKCKPLFFNPSNETLFLQTKLYEIFVKQNSNNFLVLIFLWINVFVRMSFKCKWPLTVQQHTKEELKMINEGLCFVVLEFIYKDFINNHT